MGCPELRFVSTTELRALGGRSASPSSVRDNPDVIKLNSRCLNVKFFAGLSFEQNLKPSRTSVGRKVDNLMLALRSL